jgi:hypothetical protein
MVSLDLCSTTTIFPSIRVAPASSPWRLCRGHRIIVIPRRCSSGTSFFLFRFELLLARLWHMFTGNQATREYGKTLEGSSMEKWMNLSMVCFKPCHPFLDIGTSFSFFMHTDAVML